MTKLRMLVTKAIDLEIHMQRYRGETCDGGYMVFSLHIVADDRYDSGWWSTLDLQGTNKELNSKALFKCLFSTFPYLSQTNFKTSRTNNFHILHCSIIHFSPSHSIISFSSANNISSTVLFKKHLFKISNLA